MRAPAEGRRNQGCVKRIVSFYRFIFDQFSALSVGDRHAGVLVAGVELSELR